jgi:hypothetical protein
VAVPAVCVALVVAFGVGVRVFVDDEFVAVGVALAAGVGVGVGDGVAVGDAVGVDVGPPCQSTIALS